MQKSSELLFSVPEDLVNKAVEKFQQGKRFEYSQNQVVSDKGISFSGVKYVFYPNEKDRIFELEKQLNQLRAVSDKKYFDLEEINKTTEPFVVYDRVSDCIVSLPVLEYLNLIVSNYGKDKEKLSVYIKPQIISLREWLSDKDWGIHEFQFSNQVMVSLRKSFKRFMDKHVVYNDSIEKSKVSNNNVVNVLHSTIGNLKLGLLGKSNFYPNRESNNFYPRWYFRSFNCILESLRTLMTSGIEYSYSDNGITEDQDHLYFLTENDFILSNSMLRERINFSKELVLKQSLQNLLIEQCGVLTSSIGELPKPRFELNRIKIEEINRLYMFDYGSNRDFKSASYRKHREYFEMIYFRYWYPYQYVLEAPNILEFKMLKAWNNIKCRNYHDEK